MQDLRNELRDIVFAAIEDVNALRAPGDRIASTLDTVLTGEQGPLDSLGFVNLIVALEERLDAAFGTHVSLLDDERLDPTSGHFRTVGALIEYLGHIGVGKANV